VLDDRIWVADLEAGQMVWIDRKTRTIGGAIGDLRGPCGVQAIDGALWVAVDDGIARIDPATGKATVTTLDGGAAFPGAGLPLWAATYRSGDLLRIDPHSGDVTLTVPHPGGGAEGPALALGFDSLWVGGALDSVYRLDPTTGKVWAKIQTSPPARLLATADGLWVTSYNGGTIERIDPATNMVVYRAQLHGSINGITEGPGGIWVSDTSNGRLFLIDPSATGVAP
jgi:virginiamycin B lyase